MAMQRCSDKGEQTYSETTCETEEEENKRLYAKALVTEEF